VPAEDLRLLGSAIRGALHLRELFELGRAIGKTRQMTSDGEDCRVDKTSLESRRALAGLSANDMEVLRRLAPWAHRIAPSVIREFYDTLFSHAPTRRFLEAHARSFHVSVEHLRRSLEDTQTCYLQEIFEEASFQEPFGERYFEKRLAIGRLHNRINLPLKLYIGAFSPLYQLLSKHLRRHLMLRPRLRVRAERAIRSVFNFDMQAAVDAFFYDFLRDLGFNLRNIATDLRDEDVSDRSAELKAALHDVFFEAMRVSESLSVESVRLTTAVECVGVSNRNITPTIHDLAERTHVQAGAASRVSDSVQETSELIDHVAAGAQGQLESAKVASTTMSQLEAAFEEVRRGSELQLEGMGRVISLRTALAETVSRVRDGAEEVAVTTGQAASNAEAGIEIAQQTVDRMECLSEETNALATRVYALGENAEKIERVVASINEVAEETNLLSLNAAIAAAQAGEHGRGFAVVASEIRKLAERSATAARDAAGLICGVQRGAAEVASAMQDASLGVSETNERVLETMRVFQEIVRTVQRASEQVLETRDGVWGVDTESQSLGEVVIEALKIARQNLESTADMRSLGTALNEMISRMKEIAGKHAQTAQQIAARSREVAGSAEAIARASAENTASVESVWGSTQEMGTQFEEMQHIVQCCMQISAKLRDVSEQFEFDAAPTFVGMTERSQDSSARQRDDGGERAPHPRRSSGGASAQLEMPSSPAG